MHTSFYTTPRTDDLCTGNQNSEASQNVQFVGGHIDQSTNYMSWTIWRKGEAEIFHEL
jgi:hypothetical protein